MSRRASLIADGGRFAGRGIRLLLEADLLSYIPPPMLLLMTMSQHTFRTRHWQWHFMQHSHAGLI